MYYVIDRSYSDPVSFETLYAAEQYAESVGGSIIPESDVAPEFQVVCVGD